MPKSTTGASGTDITVSTKPDALIRKGYNFVEWNTQPDGNGTGYIPGSTLTLTADTTLYAIWTIATYTITFNYRGATGGNTIPSITLEHSQKYGDNGSLPVPTKTGYDFKGWYTTSAITGTAVTDTTTFSLGADTTLYAGWTEKSGFEVIYNSNGGNTISNGSVNWTGTVLPISNPTKTGYDFDGWTYNGTPVSSSDTYGELSGDDSSNSSITLDAQWKAKTGFTVYYDLNGGTSSTIPASAMVSWTETIFPTTNPANTGNVFLGWTNVSGSTTAITNTTYGALALDDDITNSVTLYAIWGSTSGTEKIVKFDSQGGSLVSDEVLTDGMQAVGDCLPTSDPTRPGYTFKEWNTQDDGMGIAITSSSLDNFNSISGGNDELTLYAVWTANTYTIQYTNVDSAINDETLSWSDTVTYHIPTKTGYIFAGWYYDSKQVTSGATVSTLIPNDDVTNNTLTLEARWTERTYNLIYYKDANTYQETVSNVKYSALLSSAAPNSTPIKTGYTFKGWNTDSDATGVLDPGVDSVADIIARMSAPDDSVSNINLYGIWDAKGGYTVYYYSQSDPVPVHTESNVKWTDNGFITYAPGLSRYGYTLSAWKVSNTTVYDATTYGDLAGNDTTMSINMIAQWLEKSYTVEYKDPSGENTDTIESVSWGGSIMQSAPDFNRPGYSLSWEYSNSIVSENATVSSLNPNDDALNDTLTLTAAWTANTYTIRFDGNEADGGSMSDLSMTYDTAANLTANAYTRTGYTFAGWSTIAIGSVVYTDERQVINLTSTAGDVVTLYAQWTAKSYSVIYNTLGGSFISPKTVGWTQTDLLPLSDPIKAGYIFNGWLCDATPVTANTAYSDLAVNDTEESITLGAQWTEKSYTIVFEDPSGANTYKTETVFWSGDVLSNEPAFTRTGYTLVGWKYNNYDVAANAAVSSLIPSDDATNDTLTLSAVWSANVYTITYELGGGTNDGSNPASYTYGDGVTTLADAARSGYTFIGWFDAVSGGTQITGIDATKTGAVTLYARWKANIYPITYDLGGGTNASGNPASYTYGDGVISFGDATRNGYTFDGWFDAASGGTQITEITTTQAGAVSLYAQWTEKSYTIEFKDPSGTNADIIETVNWSGSVLSNEPAFTRTGYTFNGWKYNNNDVAASAIVSSLIPNDDATGDTLTLTAQWSVNSYSVTFEAGTNGSIPSGISPVTVAYDTKITEANVPTVTANSGYEFVGWLNSADNIVYNAADAADYVVTADVTFIAQYTALSDATVIFYYNGGTDGDGAAYKQIDGTPGTQFSIPSDPTKTGHDFTGWSPSVNTTFGSSGSVTTYTATWTVKSYDVTFNAGTNGSIPSGSSPVTVAYDATITSANVPTVTWNSGYEFIGWECSADNALYSAAATAAYVVNADVTFTAQYAKLADATVIFEYDGGIDEDGAGYKILSGTQGTQFAVPSDPTKTEYAFDGWEPSVNSTFGSAGSITTYTAKWSANIYDITYELDGGTNDTTNPGEYAYGSGITGFADATKPGCTFVGWFDAVSGGNQITKISTTQTGTVTLYARWAAKSYNVIYDTAEGSFIPPKTVEWRDTTCFHRTSPSRQVISLVDGSAVSRM